MIIGTYVIIKHISMKLATILALLLVLSSCSRILAILDNKSLQDTHSLFFKLLEKDNQLEFAYSF